MEDSSKSADAGENQDTDINTPVSEYWFVSLERGLEADYKDTDPFESYRRIYRWPVQVRLLLTAGRTTERDLSSVSSRQRTHHSHRLELQHPSITKHMSPDSERGTSDLVL